MVYGCITVECPRCGSRIEIASGGGVAEIFSCPVCQEGEIYYKAEKPALQPVSVIPEKKPHLKPYVTTLSNIWIN